MISSLSFAAEVWLPFLSLNLSLLDFVSTLFFKQLENGKGNTFNKYIFLKTIIYWFRSKTRRPFGFGNGKIISVVIGTTAILVHGVVLGFVPMCMWVCGKYTNVYFTFQVSRYILMGLVSFYVLLNFFMIVGILKKIGWILVTWMTFTILHVGLAFMAIHTYFYVNWLTILICVWLVIFTTISVLIVEEYCWTIKSGSSTTDVIPLETFRN